jgi:hypothetical protein
MDRATFRFGSGIVHKPEAPGFSQLRFKFGQVPGIARYIIAEPSANFGPDPSHLRNNRFRIHLSFLQGAETE